MVQTIPQYDLEELRSSIVSRAEDVCRYLLPGGKRKGDRWVCGGCDGGPGRSLDVVLDGEKAGLWIDRATGEGGDLIALWMACRSVDFKEAIRLAADFIGMHVEARPPAPRSLDPRNFRYDEPEDDGPPPPPPLGQSRPAIDWPACVQAFDEAKMKEFSEWRGYSLEFVQWLKSESLIGIYKGNFAFPVHDKDGVVVRVHYKIGDRGWAYYPTGGESAPLIIGDIENASYNLAFESQFDAFAILEMIHAHKEENRGRYTAIITRGATSNTDFSKYEIRELIACPQNDPREKASKISGRTPAEEWLHQIQTTRKRTTQFAVFETPEKHKDANDWIKADRPDHFEVFSKVIEGAKNPLSRNIVRGFMEYPTAPKPETILAGIGQIRVGDMHFLNGPSGDGKSVGSSQLSMSWSLGLPYFGIHPKRPLKIIHFCGEDDEATIGQCREGFLIHSKEITGKKLTAHDLEGLAEMVRTDFSREYVGDAFLRRLDELLAEEHADLILINPLLSFIGGPIVESISSFLREGLGPILLRHKCAALIAHHTCKLTKDSWDNMDFTYSGIGGGEVANIPRSIFTLAPTKVKGLRALHVSKRQTVGWRDENGHYTDQAFFKRSPDPTRPAWLPVSHSEAEQMIASENGFSGAGRKPKASIDDVIEVLRTGPTTLAATIELVMKACGCGKTNAKSIVNNARLGAVKSFKEKHPDTDKEVTWLCLPEHLEMLGQNQVDPLTLTLTPAEGA